MMPSETGGLNGCSNGDGSMSSEERAQLIARARDDIFGACVAAVGDTSSDVDATAAVDVVEMAAAAVGPTTVAMTLAESSLVGFESGGTMRGRRIDRVLVTFRLR